MLIHKLAPNNVNSSHYDQRFRIWLESFRPHLTTTSTVKTVSVTIAAKYEGDFYGLLSHLKVPKEYHYIVMTINGYRHSGDYDGNRTEVVLPDFGYISTVRSLFTTALKNLE